MSSINARAIAQDEYGNIWIGNHSTGIDFISARKSDFSIFNKPGGLWDNNVIYSITPAKSGGLWIAGDTELALWQDGNAKKRYVSREKNTPVKSINIIEMRNTRFAPKISFSATRSAVIIEIATGTPAWDTVIAKKYIGNAIW